MDFLHRNMDTLKGKFPHMANVPKLPKLKTRKIFSTSRDNIPSQIDDTMTKPTNLRMPSPSGAVDLTPSRIGTISSLVDGAQQSNFDIPEEFIGRSPIGGRRRIRFSDSSINSGNQFQTGNEKRRFSSQQQTTNSSGTETTSSTNKTRFSEKLTKQYKELSEFKLSHLFGKKTVVRKTEIEVNTYLQGFEQSDGIDNRTYSHDESNIGRTIGMKHDIDDNCYRRRISETSNFNVDIKSLPSGSEPSPLPKPKAALKMPPIPITPDHISMSPIPERQVETEQSLPRMTSETPIMAPLSKRKVISPEEPDSLESINMNDFGQTPEKSFKIYSEMQRKSSAKSGRSISSPASSLRSRSGSQKSRGMWELKRPLRIKATPEDFKNPVDPASLESVSDFRKTLTYVFKKVNSNNETAANENGEVPPPKPSAFKRIQMSAKTRAKRESSRPQTSEPEEESEFKKQFKKIRSNTEKLKNLIKNDTDNTTTSQAKPSSSANEEILEGTENPEKEKTIEEIEKMGYGRKNLKYIEKWKIRRRRELRRNEPFPNSTAKEEESEENKTFESEEGETKKASGESSQLADLKKSLAKALKKRQLATSVSSDSPTGDETGQEQQQPQTNMRRGIGSLFKKQLKPSVSLDETLNETTLDTREQISENEPKTPFWKKSLKKKLPENLSKSSEDVFKSTTEAEHKLEPIKKPSIFEKAKSKVGKLKSFQKPSIDETDNKASDTASFVNPIQNRYLDNLDYIDEETARAIEEMERGCAKSHDNLPTATWQSQKLLINPEFSSGSEESISTPGYLSHDNAPNCDTYMSSEPTVIILSGPIMPPPSITSPSKVPGDLRKLYPKLQSEIEEMEALRRGSPSPIPFQKAQENSIFQASKSSSQSSPVPTETLIGIDDSNENESQILKSSIEMFDRPKSISPGSFKDLDELFESPILLRSNLIKSAGFHDLAAASLNSPIGSPILGRRDYQSTTQHLSISPVINNRCSSPLLSPPAETPPPLPKCSPPPLFETGTKIYPDLPADFECAFGITPDVLSSHKYNFKSEQLQIILESPNSATNSLDAIELQIESNSTSPFATPIQSPPKILRQSPSPQPNENSIPKLNSPISKMKSINQNDRIETNPSAIPRPRHSRKPSMDKPPIEPVSAIRNIRSPIVGLNKIEEKSENHSTESTPTETVKKWSSIDIFNGNEEAFTDFDEELKNVPVVQIQIAKNPNYLTVSNDMENNNREYKSMSPTLERSSEQLMNLKECDNNDIETINEECLQPVGIAVLSDRPKPSKPVVKQASLRRQFSDEKEAAALNKNIDVNKLRSKFENGNIPPRPAERMSFRKYDKVETVIDKQDMNSSNTQQSTHESQLPPLIPRRTKIIKQTSSLEVETDGSDTPTELYEPLQDFVGEHQQNKCNRKEAIPMMDVQLTSTATIKAIQAKQQYEANLRVEKPQVSNTNIPLVESLKTSIATLKQTKITVNTTPPLTPSPSPPPQPPPLPADIKIKQKILTPEHPSSIVVGKSSTAKIFQYQQELAIKQEKEKLLKEQNLKDQMLAGSSISKNECSQNSKGPNTIVDEIPQLMNAQKNTENKATVSSVTATVRTVPVPSPSGSINPKQPNSNIQQMNEYNPVTNRDTTNPSVTQEGNDSCDEEGYSFNNERIKLSELKKDEMFYSLDDEEYQQYSLNGQTVVKELYTIEI